MAEWKMHGKAVLFAIHLQEGIIGKGTYMGPQIWERSNKAWRESGCLDNCKKLVAGFRKNNLPVVWISAAANPFGFLTNNRFGQTIEKIDVNAMFPSPGREKIVRESLEVMPEMDRRPDEPLYINWLQGAFTGSGLSVYLRWNDIDIVVLCGFALGGAVYATAMQAGDNLVSCIIASDAVSAQPNKDPDKTMLEMLEPFSLVTNTIDIIAHLCEAETPGRDGY